MFYSDLDFTNKVNDKHGNVKFFRQKLRDIGKLEDRQKLDDQHVKLFEKIKEYRTNYGCPWEKAIDHELAIAYPEISSEESNELTMEEIQRENNLMLRELLERVKRLEELFA